jgi:hypothetical protein
MINFIVKSDLLKKYQKLRRHQKVIKIKRLLKFDNIDSEINHWRKFEDFS